MGYRDGLVGAWLFNDAGNRQLRDSGPYGLHSTLNGTSDWDSSGQGWTLSLNGSSGNYASVTSENLGSLDGGVTIAAWLTRLSTGTNKGVISNWTSSLFAWMLWQETSTILTFAVREGGANRAARASGFTNGTTWHVVGTIANGQAVLVVNGGEQIIEGDAVPGVPAADNQLDFGRYANSSTNNWTGKMRHVLLWNRSMGIAEAQGVYHGVLQDLSFPL